MIQNTRVEARAEAALDSVCRAGEASRHVPRVTIVCAHPDDEVIGAGGRLSYLRDVTVVHVTDGSPRDLTDAIANGFTSREQYARARAEERERALALSGISADRIDDIGLVDQEASFTLSELTYCLVALLERRHPDVVLTHAYEGGHPDHDATAFAVHHAVQLIRQGDGLAPVIAELTGYHWRDDAMRRGEFLPGAHERVRTVPLGSKERCVKRAMFACYATQQRVLSSFSTDAECFRLAPAYDFTAPPHAGRLFYEWFDWRVDGAQWRRLARGALIELGGVETPC